MNLLPHRELTYYFFGLRAGLANLRTNGLELGFKKTAGKILQPINSYMRFPEYHWFDLAISNHMAGMPSKVLPVVLDVGSPKMFGLRLAVKSAMDLTLTDISKLNIAEYEVMWQALQHRAKGQLRFALEDARALRYPSSHFDIVYSMSVIEHIEGQHGDANAVSEFLRVLKPGGLLVLSVPFGSTYIEQKRIGFADAVRKTTDQQSYFFQRIYNAQMFQNRILNSLTQLNELRIITVRRSHPWVNRVLGALGENMGGILGGLNPILSAFGNRSTKGLASNLVTQYAEFYTLQDVYGDIILSGIKS